MGSGFFVLQRSESDSRSTFQYDVGESPTLLSSHVWGGKDRRDQGERSTLKFQVSTCVHAKARFIFRQSGP